MLATPAVQPIPSDRLKNVSPTMSSTRPTSSSDMLSKLPAFETRLSNAIRRDSATNPDHVRTHGVSLADTGGNNGVGRAGRVDQARREQRVDDARPADNERAESRRETQAAKRRRESSRDDDAARRVDEAEDTSAEETAEPEEKKARKADELTPEAIAAAILTQGAAADSAEDVAPIAEKVTEAEAIDPASTTLALAAAGAAAVQDDAVEGADAGAADADPHVAAKVGVEVPAEAKTQTPSNSPEEAGAVAVTPTQPAGDNSKDAGGSGRDANKDDAQSEGRPHPQQVAKATAESPDVAAAANAGPQPAAPVEAPKSEKFDAALNRLSAIVDPNQAAQAKPTDAKVVSAPVAPEHQFARDNLDKLVTSVRTQAATAADGKATGNQMHIRLDPPELGALEVAVKMVDGKMSASFTTTNDQATQLLSHNLNQLKSTLEASGVQVDRIQVRQASESNSSSSSSNNNGNDSRSNDGRTTQQYDGGAQQNNQQRKDAVERMWRRFAYGSDDLDLVA